MPTGLILMKWDDIIGPNVMLKYPDDFESNHLTLMQVYGQHEYSGEAGTISLSSGPINLISYYSGPKKGYYVILFLKDTEDPDEYKSGLIDISLVILQNLKGDEYVRLIPYLIKKISQYSIITDEQRLIYVYQNEIYRTIMYRLRDEGVIDKFELKAWLKDKYRNTFVDSESPLIELIKLGFIKETSISGRGIPSILIFLIKDIVMIRIPPSIILKDPIQKGLPIKFLETYQKDISKFFSAYYPTDQDNHIFLEMFANPLGYELLMLLRNQVLKKSDLEHFFPQETTDLSQTLKKIEENKIIKIYKENFEDYIALFTDIYIDVFFPEYIFNVINSYYSQKSIANQILIEYLSILETEYIKFLKNQQENEKIQIQ